MNWSIVHWGCWNRFWKWITFTVREILILNHFTANNETWIVKGYREHKSFSLTCMYVHTWACIHRVSVKIMWADLLLLYCGRAARPLLPSRQPSAQWPDTDKTVGHPVLFICLLHHMRRHRVRHNVTPRAIWCLRDTNWGPSEDN